MFGMGHHRGGLLGALLAAVAIDSSAKRERMDADLAEQRRAIKEEQRQAVLARRAAEQAKREAEQRQRAARAESRRLSLVRVHETLMRELSTATVGQFKLTDLVDQQTLARFCAGITAIVAKEVSRAD